MHDTQWRGILNQTRLSKEGPVWVRVVNVWKEKKKGGHPCFFCFRATRCRAGLPCAWYHRGDWEIKAACLEEVWSGFTSSFGSPSDPSWVHFPNLYQDWKTFPLKYSHFAEIEGEGNMSDGKPSHAYWNGIEKIFTEKDAATPFKPRWTLFWATAPPCGRPANTQNSFWAASNSWSHRVDHL